MAPRPTHQPTEAPRRPARDLIEAILENMRQNLEPLKYSTLAPARYVVYLHPDELARVEGILPVLQEQAVRALGEELERLNRRPLRKYLDRVLGEAPLIENPAGEWQVDFLADPDGEVAEGDILVCSDLALPERPELGAGQRTRRITTVHVGSKTTRREEVVTLPTPTAATAPVAAPAPTPALTPAPALTLPPTPTAATAPAPIPTTYARLRYEDDAGPHTFEIARDSVTVGRGGIAHRVDVRVDGPVDVSREHLRIRRDPQSGSFFVADLSSLGSTLNGQPIPKGDDVALPHGARIGLADTIYLTFELAGR